VESGQRFKRPSHFSNLKAMSNSNLSALSMSELKAIAIELNAVPVNDKRAKQSWIDAIDLIQTLAIVPDSSTNLSMEELTLAVDEGMGFADFGNSWVAPEMPCSAEQKAISHATTIILPAKSLTALIQQELSRPNFPSGGEIEVSQIACKASGVTVFASIVVGILFLLDAIGQISYSILKYSYLLISMFGDYNPDYDFWYQIQLLIQQRQSLPVQHT
jgi:hypothetical protein